MREDQGIGQQDAEDAGRGANDRGTVDGQDFADQHLGDGTEDDGRQIGDGGAAWPPDHLDARTEHPDGEHVEQQMGEIAMQHAVAEDLPGMGQQYGQVRPEREPGHHLVIEVLLQQVEDGVDEQDGADKWGHGRSRWGGDGPASGWPGPEWE